MNENEIKDGIENDELSESASRAERIRAIKNAVRQETEKSEAETVNVHAERTPVSAEKNAGKVPHGNNVKGRKRKKKKKTLGQKFRELFPEKGDSVLEIIRKFIFLASVAAIFVCGYMIGDYYYALWKSGRLNNSIADIYDTYQPIYTTVGTEDAKPAEERYYTMLEGAQKLYEMNPDVVGYLRIPTVDGDPVVELPVVQYSDNYKYLDKNFKGEESIAGALFLDFRNHFDVVEDHRLIEKNSENLVVYGHNMLDESMFGSLRNYDWDDKFYEKHPIIHFNSNYDTYVYKIFSVFILDANDESDTKFDCWNQMNFNDEEEFYDFVNEAKRRTLRLNSVDVRYGDPLLTLSTCNKTLGDRGRLIVLARRVRNGEDPYEGTKDSLRNNNIKWPNMYYNTKPKERYDDSVIFVPYGPEDAVREAKKKLEAEEKKKKEKMKEAMEKSEKASEAKSKQEKSADEKNK